jgi:hypothetical protein
MHTPQNKVAGPPDLSSMKRPHTLRHRGNSVCSASVHPMNIRFISSLDADDEVRFATAMLSALARLLDEFPIAYAVRMETAEGKVLEHHHSPGVVSGDGPPVGDFWQSLAPERPKST